MPIVVDHEERRRVLAEIGADVIAQHGIDAATVRAIAAAAGFSTKVVTHYFADKRALLLQAFRFARDNASKLAEATQEGEDADARAYALALLPIDPAMLRNWKVWFAFWGHAATDADFAAEQRMGVDGARDRVRELMALDARYSRLAASRRKQAATDALALVIGVSIQAAFDPMNWPPRHQRRPVDAFFDGLAPKP